MHRIIDRLDRLIPSYSRVWLFLVIAANFGVYVGTRFFTAGKTHYSMALPIDRIIPFIPAFIVIYLLAFVQWIFGYLLIAQESRSFCRLYSRADVIAKLLAGLFFLFLPTTLARPPVTGKSFFDWLTAMIYRIDAPDNLFPSIHCLESWVCLRSSWFLKKAPRWYKPLSLIMTLLVFASTVFLKQHVFVDILGGILVFEAGLFLSGLMENRKQN